MPELPEVEIMTRALRRRLVGQRIRRIDAPDPKIVLPRSLVGQTILSVRRRAKYIVVRLTGPRQLLVHLGMTGWFEFRQPARHRLVLVTGAGSAWFDDPRKFGRIRAGSAAEVETALAHLGPEPLSVGFSLDALARTSRPIKVALMDQRLIAGLGNIYASESLWRANINPRRPAHRLGAAERTRLRRAIRAALRQAIAYGPRIYRVQQFAVYGRDGQPCRRCGARIRRLVQAQRSTFYCPACQR